MQVIARHLSPTRKSRVVFYQYNFYIEGSGCAGDSATSLPHKEQHRLHLECDLYIESSSEGENPFLRVLFLWFLL